MTKVRQQLAGELGLIIPGLHFGDDLRLHPGAYQIRLFQSMVGSSRLMLGRYLAIGPEEKLWSDTDDCPRCSDPVYSMPGCWIRTEQRIEAEGKRLTFIHSNRCLRQSSHRYLPASR